MRQHERGGKLNRYTQIIERIFLARHTPGAREVSFDREDLVSAAQALGVSLPKNIGDVVYTFRYRSALPEAIRALAPEGTSWIIRPAGRGRYRFVASEVALITPSEAMVETKLPDATPGVIARYALSDEQALLARIRYNRLVDIFTGVTCYSLQSHLRTTVPGLGQVETDEVYVGVDRRGVQYVFPVQAKGGRDRVSIVQIEQDAAMCAAKFPLLVRRPIAAQFMEADLIALFDFEDGDDGIALVSEKHYRLVPPDEVTDADLEAYRLRQP